MNELSLRELQVLRLAAEGLTIREIADRCGIREQTVKNHLKKVNVKLHVKNRTQAFRKQGWLVIPSDDA
jgi:DNA-binding CsgD family transcriptional regulator